MTRVHERHVSAGPSAADRHRRVDQKKKTSYKVILEEVADKQKKLKTVLYPEQKAPRGYTFIPAGDPQLTNRCKKLAREDGFTVFIVSTSRHPRQGLSREIHRVGFHFPSVTVEKACDSLGVTLSNSGRVLQSNFAHLEDGQEHDGTRSTRQKKQKAGNRNAQPVLDISLPQAVIDTSARETIKDLFPNIPNQDLHVVVGRSFQKGKGLVGTVANLSLVRRAQLAVIAHIRHTYTDYDALLRVVQYNEARRRVEKPCLDRLIQWRGDDDDTGDMDDVLREVIVIPDDDEEDHTERNETKDGRRRRHEIVERDSSVEYISEADMQIQSVDYSNTNRTFERGDSYSPESDGEIEYLGRKQLHHGWQVQYDQQTLDRMGSHRQRVYEEALDRHRKHPPNLSGSNDHSSLSLFASSRHEDLHPLSQQPQDRIHPPHLARRWEQVQEKTPIQTRLMPVTRPDTYGVDPYTRASDPRYVLEEQVAYPSQQSRRVHEGDPEQPKSMYYAGQHQSHNNRTRLGELRQAPDRVFDEEERLVSRNDVTRNKDNNLVVHDFGLQPGRHSDMVLPSIERDLRDEHEPASPYGKMRQVNPFGSFQDPLNRGLQPMPVPSIINLDDYEELPSSKKRRMDDQQTVSSYGQARTVLVPIEQINDRQPRYERPHEAAYRDDMGHFISDKRIVPLPPKEERVQPLISRQELQLSSPRKQITRNPNQVADRVEPYPKARDHYQIPLSHPERVDGLQFSSSAVFAPPEYPNDSPFFSGSSQFAPRRLETNDLGFPSRHNVGVVAHSDRFCADTNGMTRHLQPLEIAERSIPHRLKDMSIDYTQREDDRRPDRVPYLPSTATSEFHSHTGLSAAYVPDTAQDVFHKNMDPPTNAYRYDISERHLKPAHGVQQHPVWPVKQNTSSSFQPNQQFLEPDRANAFERRAPPPILRAAMEPWDTNIQSRNRPWDGSTKERRPHIGVIPALPENKRPLRREYDAIRLGQRKRPDHIVVLD